MSDLQQLIGIVASLKEQVQRMADVMQKREERREYQAAYYKKRKAAANVVVKKGLANLNRHCLEGMRDPRVPAAEWAVVMRRFVEEGRSAYNFLSWLAWKWNKDTFQHVPITRSGGYLHLFIGMSGDKPLRQKYTERELMGQIKVYTFSRPEQLEFFREAKWWTWGFHVLGSVVLIVEDEPWFKKLGNDWVCPLRLMMGCYGCYEVRQDVFFDPNEPNLVKASKMVGYVRPTLDMCWGACKNGLVSKEEPFRR